jgi:5-methylcytosine-specific restriction endonuclease McrA
MTGRRPSGGAYTSPSTFRLMIRREFYDCCAICAWDGAPCDVCHIVARKDGGTDTLDNVVMLCPNHHRRFDLGLIPAGVVRRARETVLRHPSSPPS